MWRGLRSTTPQTEQSVAEAGLWQSRAAHIEALFFHLASRRQVEGKKTLAASAIQVGKASTVVWYLFSLLWTPKYTDLGKSGFLVRHTVIIGASRVPFICLLSNTHGQTPVNKHLPTVRLRITNNLHLPVLLPISSHSFPEIISILNFVSHYLAFIYTHTHLCLNTVVYFCFELYKKIVKLYDNLRFALFTLQSITIWFIYN